MNKQIVDTLHPFCYPTELKVDLAALIDSVETLLNRLDLSLDIINEKCKNSFGFTVNLTHLPNLKGSDRWKKYNGNHPSVRKEGVFEKDFTEHLEESQDLLIGKLVHDIYKHHAGKFQGRAQLIWLSPKKSYNFHTDYHTPNRYHVPIITNENCFWLFKDKQETVFQLHMPADGRTWYLDPINIQHTFCNESDVARLHLLCTSGF